MSVRWIREPWWIRSCARTRILPPPGALVTPRSPVIPGLVWMTAESLGDDDPALAAWPDLPVAFVFDVALLTRLRLAAHRLVFLTECLADLATRRPVQVWRGRPAGVLGRRLRWRRPMRPVPGWRSRSGGLDTVAVHPWRWLVEPHAGPVTSFTAWRRRAGV